ncbi:MAG: Na/Pi cotransporter family protein [Clostridia bacterium]|jgi:phosphate:Na+ symporter|nr:Na/Pi cotransporter family protein [Clostridia bacterium]MCI2015446.1 Na/Pi cotransporter family protein [Clostridia bacterium]
MDIFSVIALLGGLAFFLYGMHVMSGGLEKISGGKLEGILRQMTSNPIKSLMLGAGITVAIQSSSAMTVMLVGLVNSGIMQLGQTIGVIMGSNIGTTLTAWLLSLAGINSSVVWIKLLKPENFAPIAAFIGIIMIMSSKSLKKKDIGSILVGFSVLMYGMVIMGQAVSPLADMPQFSGMLTAFKNPFFGVIIGAVFTGIIQSSAASVGILQALSMTGSITYSMAVPIIMGLNIGTCITSLLSSIGVNRNAKRVAVVHISFNVIGTVFCLIVFYILKNIFDFTFIESSITPIGIAAVHSIFNIVTTLLLLPFTKVLEKIAYFVIKEDNTEVKYTFIDDRLLNTPAVAVSESNNLTIDMAALAMANLLDAISLFNKYDEKKAAKIIENEDALDNYEDKLGTYLVKLSGKAISYSDTKHVSKMLHTISDFERLGDHAVNLRGSAKEIYQKDIVFSKAAQKELNVLTKALKEILDITFKAFKNNDTVLAKEVEPLEQVIDGLIGDIKSHHIDRLQNGICTIQMGFVLSDVLTNYERVSDHCSNIAVAIIETNSGSFDTHEYLNRIKYSGDEEFNERFKEFSDVFHL